MDFSVIINFIALSVAPSLINNNLKNVLLQSEIIGVASLVRHSSLLRQVRPFISSIFFFFYIRQLFVWVKKCF